MRLSDPETIHALLVCALPVLVVWLGFGVPAAFAATIVVTAAGIGRRQSRMQSPPDPALLELHTITYSHYVEKARWCLDRTGIDYHEVPSIGILGALFAARMVPTLVHPASRT